MLKPPAEDLAARQPVWESMQMFWMDTEMDLPEDVLACADSSYSLAELEAIFWNEVRPAVKFNLRFGRVLPEWAGFEREWLTQRILQKSRYGRSLPLPWLRPYSRHCWRQISAAVGELRAIPAAERPERLRRWRAERAAARAKPRT